MAKGIQEYSHFGKLLATYYKVKLQVNYYTSVNPREKNIYSHLKKLYWNIPAAFIYYCPQILKTTQKTFHW